MQRQTVAQSQWLLNIELFQIGIFKLVIPWISPASLLNSQVWSALANQLTNRKTTTVATTVYGMAIGCIPVTNTFICVILL
jgi:hypothetical protein